MGRELALVVSGGSGMVLARSFAEHALRTEGVSSLHVVVTTAARAVLGHELGPEWASARRFRDHLAVDGEARSRVHCWRDGELTAPIASGSHLLDGTVVLPCSAGMAGAIANGISRGLGQRVADVALKQGWPLLLGVRETPMSPILLENLLRLARCGARIVPPLPAFYLNAEEATAMERFVDHYCLRLLDLLGLPAAADHELRWQGPRGDGAP